MKFRNMMPWHRHRQTLPIGDQPPSPYPTDMDDIFERLLHPRFGVPSELFGKGGGDFGAVDISEKKGLFTVKIDLPGVEEDDIDLEVTDHRLTVRATREQESDDETDGYHHVERVYGSFARSFEMPDEVDPDSAKATFRHGVLKVVLHKSPSAVERTKKIAIGQ